MFVLCCTLGLVCLFSHENNHENVKNITVAQNISVFKNINKIYGTNYQTIFFLHNKSAIYYPIVKKKKKVLLQLFMILIQSNPS